MQDIQFNNYVKYDRFETPESESSKRKKATRACFHCQKVTSLSFIYYRGTLFNHEATHF